MSSITALQGELGRVGFAAAVLAVLVLTLRIVARLRSRGNRRLASSVAAVVLVVVLAGVFSLTLLGWERGAGPRLFLDPVEGAWGWDSIAWRPVVDNVLLFVPVGALAAATAWRRPPAAVWVLCVGLSIGIEAFQYLVPTGRIANAADVLANAVGALLGVLLAVALRARGGPPHPRPQRPRKGQRVDA